MIIQSWKLYNVCDLCGYRTASIEPWLFNHGNVFADDTFSSGWTGFNRAMIIQSWKPVFIYWCFVWSWGFNRAMIIQSWKQ